MLMEPDSLSSCSRHFNDVRVPISTQYFIVFPPFDFTILVTSLMDSPPDHNLGLFTEDDDSSPVRIVICPVAAVIPVHHSTYTIMCFVTV